MSACENIKLCLNLFKTQITEYFWDKKLDYDGKINEILNKFDDIEETKLVRYTKDVGTLFRNTTNNTTNNNFSLDSLNGIISINLEDKTVDVGGKTRYYNVLNETLKYGLMPKVVPELSSITVGGAITGISIESSSFKYGWGHDTVKEMDILISSGEILYCTKDNENSDLFNAIPNSYGTVGYVTRATLELIEAKNFVNVINHKFTESKEAFKFMKEIVNDNKVDFLDAVCFAKDEIYVITGILSNTAHQKPCNYPYDGIYYESIRNKKTETFTLYDYYWRWDADMFWGVKNVNFIKNKWVRKIFGRCLLNSRTLRTIQKLFKSPTQPTQPTTEKITQDLGVPYKNALEFYEWICDELKIYPLWICPVTPKKSNTLFWSYNKNQLYFDIGVFGSVKHDTNQDHQNNTNQDNTTQDNKYYNKKIEEKLLEIEGNKCFYSGTYFTRETFNKFIDQTIYSKIKEKYDKSNRLGDLYEKVVDKIN